MVEQVDENREQLTVCIKDSKIIILIDFLNDSFAETNRTIFRQYGEEKAAHENEY